MNISIPGELVTAEGVIGIVPVSNDEDVSVSVRLKEIKHEAAVSVMPSRQSIFKSIDVSSRRAYTGWFLQG